MRPVICVRFGSLWPLLLSTSVHFTESQGKNVGIWQKRRYPMASFIFIEVLSLVVVLLLNTGFELNIAFYAMVLYRETIITFKMINI